MSSVRHGNLKIAHRQQTVALRLSGRLPLLDWVLLIKQRLTSSSNAKFYSSHTDSGASSKLDFMTSTARLKVAKQPF
jgi:hypothetical protein